MNDQLSDQRIVVGRDHALGVLRRIHAHAVSAGHVESCNLARRGSELPRMFGVDSALDGVAANFELRGQNVFQPLPCGDAQLRLDQIDAGDGLGDRVLNLDARVHFDEVELLVLIHQELDCSGILIADLSQAAAHGAAQFPAQPGRNL